MAKQLEEIADTLQKQLRIKDMSKELMEGTEGRTDLVQQQTTSTSNVLKSPVTTEESKEKTVFGVGEKYDFSFNGVKPRKSSGELEIARCDRMPPKESASNLSTSLFAEINTTQNKHSLFEDHPLYNFPIASNEPSRKLILKQPTLPSVEPTAQDGTASLQPKSHFNFTTQSTLPTSTPKDIPKSILKETPVSSPKSPVSNAKSSPNTKHVLFQDATSISPSQQTPTLSALLSTPKAAVVDFAALSKMNENQTPQFGNGSKSKGFEGAGTPVFGGNRSRNDSESEPVEEFVPSAEFRPVIPLPELVEVKTGEEGEEMLFNKRAKPMRFDLGAKEWKERGLGQMKVLKDPITRITRFLMRREQVYKVCCNHRIIQSMELRPSPSNEKAWTWYAVDYAEGKKKKELFAICFKTVELAKEFKEVIDKVQKEQRDEVEAMRVTASTLTSDQVQQKTSSTLNFLKPFSTTEGAFSSTVTSGTVGSVLGSTTQASELFGSTPIMSTYQKKSGFESTTHTSGLFGTTPIMSTVQKNSAFISTTQASGLFGTTPTMSTDQKKSVFESTTQASGLFDTTPIMSTDQKKSGFESTTQASGLLGTTPLSTDQKNSAFIRTTQASGLFGTTPVMSTDQKNSAFISTTQASGLFGTTPTTSTDQKKSVFESTTQASGLFDTTPSVSTDQKKSGFESSTQASGLFGSTPIMSTDQRKSVFESTTQAYGGFPFQFTQSKSINTFGQSNSTTNSSNWEKYGFSEGSSSTYNTAIFEHAMASIGTGAVRFATFLGVEEEGLKYRRARFNCITCMPEYKGKSLEELRLEDYAANRHLKSIHIKKGLQPSGETFWSPPQPPLYRLGTNTFTYVCKDFPGTRKIKHPKKHQNPISVTQSKVIGSSNCQSTAVFSTVVSPFGAIFGKTEEFGEFKKSYSDLQGLIECPVCFGTLDSSLSVCGNGHGICGSCFKEVKKCPTCQQSYLPHKPTLLSQILERIPKSCTFETKGCDKIVYNKDNEHEAFCNFRSTACMVKSCEWKGLVKDLADHVKNCVSNREDSLCEMHFSNTPVTKTYVFDKRQNASFFSLIIFQNQLFWKYFRRDFSSKRIIHRFYHIPTSKPSHKYYLVITFKQGDIEFSSCIHASSGTENHSEDEKDGDISFVIPDSDLERFYDSDAKGYRFTQKIVVEENCN